MTKRSAVSAVLAFAALAAVAFASAVPPAQSAREWAREALGCFDLLDYEMGLKLAGRALERDPDQPDLLLRRAAVLWKLSRRDVAWLSVREVLSKYPKNWEALALSSFFHFEEERPGEAAADAEAAERQVDSEMHPEKGAKESWPRVYALGAFDEKDYGSSTRSFPVNAGLPAYIKAVLEGRRPGGKAAAERLYRRAMGLSYDAAACALSIVLGRLEDENWIGALDACREFQDRGGLRPELMLLAAVAEEGAGKRSDSEDSLQLACEMRPFEAGWVKALAAAAADRADAREAVSRIVWAERLAPGDFETRGWSEAAARGVFPFRGEFGRLLREAAAAFRPRLVPRYRYPLSGDILNVATVVNGRFLRYVQSGEFVDAAQCAGNFLEIDSRPSELAYNAALLHNSLDRTDQAFPLVWQALSTKPRYRDALDLAGQMFIKIGQPARSIFFYRGAIDAGPADAQAWFNLGFAHYSAGNTAMAGECLDTVVAMERPGHSRPESRTGADADKKFSYELDIRVEPLAYRALILLGLIAVSKGDETGAASRLQEAVELRPQSPEAYLELGRHYRRIHDQARAQAAFDRYLALGGAADQVRK
jgi:tetratricopeptide (TPR) repeat protein